jgi:hypothetical protein
MRHNGCCTTGGNRGREGAAGFAEPRALPFPLLPLLVALELDDFAFFDPLATRVVELLRVRLPGEARSLTFDLLPPFLPPRTDARVARARGGDFTGPLLRVRTLLLPDAVATLARLAGGASLSDDESELTSSESSSSELDELELLLSPSSLLLLASSSLLLLSLLSLLEGGRLLVDLVEAPRLRLRLVAAAGDWRRVRVRGGGGGEGEDEDEREGDAAAMRGRFGGRRPAVVCEAMAPSCRSSRLSEGCEADATEPFFFDLRKAGSSTG